MLLRISSLELIIMHCYVFSIVVLELSAKCEFVSSYMEHNGEQISKIYNCENLDSSTTEKEGKVSTNMDNLKDERRKGTRVRKK